MVAQKYEPQLFSPSQSSTFFILINLATILQNVSHIIHNQQFQMVLNCRSPPSEQPTKMLLPLPVTALQPDHLLDSILLSSEY